MLRSKALGLTIVVLLGLMATGVLTYELEEDEAPSRQPLNNGDLDHPHHRQQRELSSFNLSFLSGFLSGFLSTLQKITTLLSSSPLLETEPTPAPQTPESEAISTVPPTTEPPTPPRVCGEFDLNYNFVEVEGGPICGSYNAAGEFVQTSQYTDCLVVLHDSNDPPEPTQDDLNFMAEAFQAVFIESYNRYGYVFDWVVVAVEDEVNGYRQRQRLLQQEDELHRDKSSSFSSSRRSLWRRKAYTLRVNWGCNCVTDGLESDVGTRRSLEAGIKKSLKGHSPARSKKEISRSRRHLKKSGGSGEDSPDPPSIWEQAFRTFYDIFITEWFLISEFFWRLRGGGRESFQTLEGMELTCDERATIDYWPYGQ